ncbi:MAG TPA: LLM class flavin-dependent oxidoreductase [Candidatus Nanopelagicales bacterium]
MSDRIEFGLDTFGDMTVDDAGQLLPAGQVIRNVVAQGVLADSLGVEHFSIGEHHRDDFAVSAPDVVLAGLATRTERITLGTAVTVLSTDDPVRVYERFATLDGLSGGRAEITAGRGSFTESFGLFGYSLADYDVLFEERLALLVALLEGGPITWSGSTRAPLTGQQVYPRTERERIALRVGVGGTPESVVRAARFGLPMALAIIGGPPARFAPFADLYRRALAELGQPPAPLSLHCPGHLADTDEQAVAELWPPYEAMFGRIGRERGWPPRSKAQFLEEVARGALFVGSPETVARRIADTIGALGAQRFDLKYSTGTLSHPHLMRSIELYATEVIPRVRALLAQAAQEAAPRT